MQVLIGEAGPRGDLAQAINAENAAIWASLGLDPEGMLKVTGYPDGGEAPSRLYFANLARGMLSVDLVDPMSKDSIHDIRIHIPRVVGVPSCTTPYVKTYSRHVGLPLAVEARELEKESEAKDKAVDAVDSYLSTISVHEIQFERIFNGCKWLLDIGVIGEDSGIRMGDSVEHLRRLEHEHKVAIRGYFADRKVTKHGLYRFVIQRALAKRRVVEPA